MDLTNRAMHCSYRYVFVIIVLGLLSGCAYTTAPLPDINTSTIDGKLLGMWTRTEYDNKTQKTTTSTYQISRSDQPNHPSGIMMRLDVTTGPDGSVSVNSDNRTAPYFVTCIIPSPSGVSNSYESIFVNWEKEGITNSSLCIVARYRVSNNVLTIYGCSRTVGADLIDRGVIVGHVSRDSKGGVDSVTFDRDSLVRYLQKNEGDDLFPITEGLEAHSVSGTESSDSSSPVVLSPPKSSDASSTTSDGQAPSHQLDSQALLVGLVVIVFLFVVGVFIIGVIVVAVLFARRPPKK
jgi:hypothetical protein